jgi:hypothetical protein
MVLGGEALVACRHPVCEDRTFSAVPQTGVSYDRASLTAAPTHDRRHGSSQHVTEHAKGHIRAVKNFSKHFGKSPDKLTFEDVRTYQLHLVSRGLQAATIIPIMCAIRFFYCTTLGLSDVAEHIPLARRADTLPAILTRGQVVRFLKAVPDLVDSRTAVQCNRVSATPSMGRSRGQRRARHRRNLSQLRHLSPPWAIAPVG